MEIVTNNSNIRTATRPYICHACNGTIISGEKYEFATVEVRGRKHRLYNCAQCSDKIGAEVQP